MATENARIGKEHWHLDKRVNISIIIALVAQAALGLTWANNLTFQVEQLSKDMHRIEKSMDRKTDERRTLEQLVVALKTQMADVVVEIKETRREYRTSNARLWDETRNLRNAIVANSHKIPNHTTRAPSMAPPVPSKR